MTEEKQRTGKAPLQFRCPVSNDECTGKINNDGYKTHTSQAEVRRCKETSLRKQGHVRIGSRAWRPPDGGPILILCKRSERSKPGKGARHFTKGSITSW